MRILTPNSDSERPALAIGATMSGAGLVAALLIEYGLDEPRATVLALVLWPLLQAIWTQARVYAPATVSRLLAAVRGRAGDGEGMPR